MVRQAGIWFVFRCAKRVMVPNPCDKYFNHRACCVQCQYDSVGLSGTPGTANEQMVLTISRFSPAATRANASGLSALGYFFSTTAVIYPGSFLQIQVWCAAGAFGAFGMSA